MKYISSVLHLWFGLLAMSLLLASPNAWSATQLGLDGIDDMVQEPTGTPSPSPLDITTFTIEAWILPTQRKSWSYIVVDSAYILSTEDKGNGEIGVSLSLNYGYGHSHTFEIRGLVLNQWNHVAGAYDASANICWLAINGKVSVLNNCGVDILDPGDDTLFHIGDAFIGRIAEVRLSNVIRYSSDFNLPTSCFSPDASTVGLWHLDEAANSTTFGDSSGNNHTLHGLYGAKTIEGLGPPISCDRPVVKLDPKNIAFGEQRVDVASAPRTVTLTNTGTATLNINSIVTSGDFAKAGATCGATLAAGANCTINVTFTPTTEGNRTGQLTLTTDARGSPHTVPLSGVGVGTVSPNPGSLDFGEQRIGVASAPRTVTLTNTGAATLNINSIVASGNFAKAGATCGATLAVGATCTISVTFKPTAIGYRSSKLTIASDASDSPHRVSLSGTGIQVFKLEIKKRGSGRGTVTSEPSGINCGSDCTQDYLLGTTVTLTAHNPFDSIFKGWSGGCNTTAPTCRVILNQARTVTATFESLFELTVSITGDGAGIVTSTPSGIKCGTKDRFEYHTDCAHAYSNGEIVTLKAQSDSDSRFDSWSGECKGKALTCRVTMSRVRTVVANFKPKIAGPYDGIWSGNTASQNKPIKLHIVSNKVCYNIQFVGCGYQSFGLQTCGDQIYNNRFTSSRCLVYEGLCIDFSGVFNSSTTVSGNLRVQSQYGGVCLNTTWKGKKRFNLVVIKGGSGSGTVTSSPSGINCGSDCDHSYGSGVKVKLTAKAASGSTFAGWSGSCSGRSSSCQVTMSKARIVKATFNRRSQAGAYDSLELLTPLEGLPESDDTDESSPIPLPWESGR